MCVYVRGEGVKCGCDSGVSLSIIVIQPAMGRSLDRKELGLAKELALSPPPRSLLASLSTNQFPFCTVVPR